MLWFKFEADSKEFSINSSIDIEISNEKLDLWKDKIILLKNKRKKGGIALWWSTWSKLERPGFHRNELGLSNRIPVFTQRFPGSARSKCCKLLKGNIYMAKKCFDVRINDFGDWSSLFCNFFMRSGFRVGFMSVSFCLNSNEICDRTYRRINFSLRTYV